ncbi:MAG: carbohydrate-binding domain-containing protein, partial [Acholeplasmatales bacterium]|nr:carbohydrate-binding domain-containing protein [Acholeplasmatales bacterium]
TLTSTASDGINAAGVAISAGTVTVTSKNDGIQGDDSVEITGGEVTITANGGTSGSATLASSSTSFVFSEEDTSSFTTASEYYGLYVLKSGTYIEIDEDNYSTYKSYTTFYDRASCKGLKSDTLISITGGSVNINSLDDGINCDVEVNISGGNTVIQTKCDGINADSLLQVTDGSLNVTTEGTFYSVSGGSYKKSGSTYVKTDSGSYDMYTSCKGLKSGSEIVLSGGTYVIDSSDDSIHSDEYITILGGEYTIDTLDDGMHADTTLQIGESGGDNSDISIKINTSYEGIEAGTINVYSGTIDAYATDDCMNAGGGSDSSSTGDTFTPGGSTGGFMGGSTSSSSSSSSYSINIYGGVMVLYCPSGDTDVVDSNGAYNQSGGLVIAHNAGSSGTGTALDCDGSATITGGIFVAIGNLETTPSVSNVTKKTVSVSLSSGTTYTLTDSSETLASFTMRATYSKITFIAPSGTYKILQGSTTVTTISV